MLETRVPHEAIRTWKGFLTHIATITIGIVIALGLEQTVEFLHHRHQRLQLEEQLRETLNDDTHVVGEDIEKLTAFRPYLAEMQAAIVARRHGQASPPGPPADDPRASFTLTLPSLAAYEAAKDNGAVALLSSQRMRLYNRIAFQHELLKAVYTGWFDDLAALGAFGRRFDYSATRNGAPALRVDVDALSPAELIEYQTLTATLMNRVDWMLKRLRIFGNQCRAMLDGARDEKELSAGMRASP